MIIPSAGAEATNGRPFWRMLAAALATLLVVGELGIGGVWDLLRIPYAREVMTRLGYPTYLLVIVGAFKLPAAIVLMIPGLGRLKEWAYAGAFITYLGTSVSHLAVGDDMSVTLVPGTLAALTLASWWLRAPRARARAHSTAAGARSIAYWATTLLLSACCLLGAVFAGLHLQPAIGIVLRLGYPTYFLTLLGVAFLAAAVTLLVPRSPRIKEWAYAGLVFALAGALASHLFVGDGASSLLAPGALLALTLASWALRPPARRSVRSGWDAAHEVAYGS